jgi:hypothetical protein
MSAYFLFSIADRPAVKSENPEASFGDIARAISVRFKNLSPRERKIWSAMSMIWKSTGDNIKKTFHALFFPLVVAGTIACYSFSM